jgi:MoxR-like ATPase
MFDINLNTISAELEKQNYIADKQVEYAIFAAVKSQKPLLIEGPAGVGKTELAKVLANMFNAELTRLQCYEGIDVSKVIYDINYSKQLLYQNILKESIVSNLENKSFQASIKYLNEKTNFYSEDFLIERPLLHAISPNNNTKKVLLIDELDKADSEIEAFLLETLSDYSVSIPEYGTVQADPTNIPIVVITSNNQRELSEAIRRRCAYLYIGYPSIEVESKIIYTKAKTDKNFADLVANFINKLRTEIKLKQKPSIAESIEWANLLFNHLNVTSISKKFEEEINMTLNLLSKNNKDLEKTKIFTESFLV